MPDRILNIQSFIEIKRYWQRAS